MNPTYLAILLLSLPVAAQVKLPAFPTAVTVATNKTQWLRWDGPTNATGYAVYTGPSRSALTNRTTVSTNQVRYYSTNHYGVKTIGAGGLESTMAFWPSNRIAEIWLRDMGANVTGGTNIIRLARFTNNPPEKKRFWGVADVTVGWE